MNQKDFNEGMKGLPQELDRLYGPSWRSLATLDDLTAADLAKCPDCHKTHRPSYHEQEPCNACCDKFIEQNISKTP